MGEVLPNKLPKPIDKEKSMTLAEFLMELGALFIAFGLTIGSFCLILYVLAWLVEKGERRD